MTRPMRAARSSSTTVNSAGSLELLSAARAPVSPRWALNSLTATQVDTSSKQIATREHDVVDERMLDGMRMQQLLHALVDRYAGAHGEQQDGDNEAPEVQLLAVAERVARVGGLARPAHAEQQQALVGRVGYGVQRLRQHRGRAGDRGRHEFRHRNQRVGAERRNHHPRRAVGRHFSLRAGLLSTPPNPAYAYAANTHAANAYAADASVSVVAAAPTYTPVANPADATVVATIVGRRRVTVAHVTVTTRCYGCDGSSRSISITPASCGLGLPRARRGAATTKAAAIVRIRI